MFQSIENVTCHPRRLKFETNFLEQRTAEDYRNSVEIIQAKRPKLKGGGGRNKPVAENLKIRTTKLKQADDRSYWAILGLEGQAIRPNIP